MAVLAPVRSIRGVVPGVHASLVSGVIVVVAVEVAVLGVPVGVFVLVAVGLGVPDVAVGVLVFVGVTHSSSPSW